MSIKNIQNKSKESESAMIKIPLSSLRLILSYPKENKLICEIDTKSIKKVNKSIGIDEIISESRLDYMLGDYKTFNSSKKLIAELRS